jgi:hypothetical protein
MKKKYFKPTAENVSFYTEEDIADVLTIADGEILSGSLGEGEVEGEDWT